MNIKEIGIKSMGLGIQDIVLSETLIIAGILPKELSVDYSK